MAVNSNWHRWILSSILQHFDAYKGTYTLVFEGMHKKLAVDAADIFEIRVDGPSVKELSKDYYELYAEVNVLVRAALSDTDLFTLQRMIGQILPGFIGIEVKEYGDGDAHLGCLQLMTDPGRSGSNRIEVSTFGQIDANIKIQHATVEGHYLMHLTV